MLFFANVKMIDLLFEHFEIEVSSMDKDGDKK